MRTLASAVIVAMVGMSAAVLDASGQPADTARRSLDVRVTIDFRDRPARDVLETLTKAAGLTLEVATGPLLPVTAAVTNVRLETALTAVCENASCRWTLRDRAIVVTPVPLDGGTTLPAAVSIALSEASVRDVFRALAAALNVQLQIDGDLPDEPVTIAFRNAAPENVLNFLAQVAKCSWQLESGRLVVRRLL